MFAFLKSTQKDEFVDTRNRSPVFKKKICTLKGVTVNFLTGFSYFRYRRLPVRIKKVFFSKKNPILGYHLNLISASQMVTIEAPSL
jgi:hypothetical protein